ncbi:MAG: D-alanine--D-alanine ligase family protein [Candidatus Flexifilum sp.]
MSARRKTVIGVIFGGRSVEHDVSVVTGHQVMRALSRERYDVIPIYIDRNGRWYTGAPLLDLKQFQQDITRAPGVIPCTLSPSTQHHGLILNPGSAGFLRRSTIQRLDVLFPALHGTHGEDGTVQGLLELADIPYVGCGVLASAIANDKWLCKVVLRAQGLPVVDGLLIDRSEWDDDRDAVIERIVAELGYPVYVKPATLGSSIGIARAGDRTMLAAALDVATNLDRRVVVEREVTDALEINCAVMGDGRAIRASTLEQPISYEQFLTFEDKYLRGGSEGMKSAERIIPAPLPPELTTHIQELARSAFRAVSGYGIARIDFLVRKDLSAVWINEINTMPGSLAFYLWQETDLSPEQTVDELVALAREANAQKRRNTYDYRSSLLSLTAARGLKGTKGSKASRTS